MQYIPEDSHTGGADTTHGLCPRVAFRGIQALHFHFFVYVITLNMCTGRKGST